MRWLVVITLLSLHHLFGAVLQLRNGKEVHGELASPAITIHTAYGSVVITSNHLGQVISMPGTEPDTVLTTSGNRFSGYIYETVSLRSPGNEPATFSHLDIQSLKVAVPRPAPSMHVVLNNGDVLSGKLTLPALAVTNAAGAEVLPAQEIDSFWFVKNDRNVRVQMRDGKQARAFFPQNSLTIALDIGGKLELPRAMLKTVYCRSDLVPPELPSFVAGGSRTNSLVPSPERMVWIPPGDVLLGSPLDERGRNSDEDPRTLVSITRGFWIGQFEVTQGEYAAVMGQNPSTFQGDTNRPVEKVSWHDANEYCARLTEKARRDGLLPAGFVYRLPTEAEWEYACRAGTTTRFSFGEDPDERELREHAWFVDNSGWSTHPVGQLKANPWGLFDMHGNVLEWCAGIWNEAYPGGKVVDYQGPSDGWLRVARGGSWLYGAPFARSANRDDYGAGNRCSDLGFRVVLAAPL